MRANDSIQVTAGSGATGGTWSPHGSNTTEYHPFMRLGGGDPDIAPTGSRYGVTTPRVAVLQNKYMWELFNGATSGLTLWLDDVFVNSPSDIVSAANRQTRYFLFRTTALSSGGTACTYESASTLSANFFRFDSGDPALSSTITMKTVLTSITTGALIREVYAALVETRFEDLLQQMNDDTPFWREDVIPRFPRAIKVPPGEGVACRQGPNAASGSTVEFTLTFRTA